MSKDAAENTPHRRSRRCTRPVVPDAATWGTVPRSYVRFTADRAIPTALQDRMITEADRLAPATAFDVHSIVSGHLCMPDTSEELALILDLLA